MQGRADVVGIPAGAELCIRYLVAIREIDLVAPFVERTTPLHAEILVELPSIVVVGLRSPHRHRARPGVSAHAVIDADIDAIRAQVPEIGERYAEVDGKVVGNRWPVVFVAQPGQPAGPEHASSEISWDNAVIQGSDPELADRMVRILATSFARYRVLAQGIDLSRQLLREIEATAPDEPLPAGIVERFLGERQVLMASRVLADARSDVYWGCEHALLRRVYDVWGIGDIERVADEAVTATTTIWKERATRLAQIENAQQARSTRRAAAALLLLTLLSGLSAVSALIDFTGSDGRLTLTIARGAVGAALVTLFVVLLVLNKEAFKQGGIRRDA